MPPARDLRIPAPRDRFVLLHYHVFKNAGSTIDYALRRSFGDGFADFHGTHDDAVLVGEDAIALLRDEPALCALSSHHLRHPRPQARGFVFFDLWFVRHPLTRIRSLYHYGRRTDPAHWLAQLANARDEAGFVGHLLDHLPHMIADVQINHLVNGGAFARAAGPRDFDRALAILADMSVPGVVEKFDESLVVGEFFLRPAFPAIDFAYVAQNVSAPDGPHPSGRDDALERCRTAWGDALFEAVIGLNQWDLRLHAAACEEVDRRLAMLPHPHARLAAFRERCRALVAQ